jgi:hypothetical protein
MRDRWGLVMIMIDGPVSQHVDLRRGVTAER